MTDGLTGAAWPGKPAVSVVMPVYNCATYLPEALECLAAQDMADFEVIMVDDGSTDGSADVARSVAMRDPRFRYIRQDHAGAGPARNAGMDVARGDYLIFLDGDDRFEPTMLGRLLAAARRTGADVVACRDDSFDTASGKVRNPARGNLATPDAGVIIPAQDDRLYQRFNCATWNKLLDARFFKGLGLRFQSLRYSNDTYAIYAALPEAGRIAVIDDVLLHYRLGTGSSLRDAPADQPLCDLIAYDAVFERISQRERWGEGLRRSFAEECARRMSAQALIFATVDHRALQVFCEEYFSRYEHKWGVDGLRWGDFLFRATALKYLCMRNCSVRGFEWACRARGWKRSEATDGTLRKKAFYALRLLLASMFTPSMARTYGAGKRRDGVCARLS